MAKRRQHKRKFQTAASLDSVGIGKIAGTVALVLPVAALLAVAALRSSVAEVYAGSRAADALAWNSLNAEASGALSRRLILAGKVEAGRHLAARAIVRSPLVPNAYAALALAAEADGTLPTAKRLMAIAHSISRRETATELWLARQAVEDQDYKTALAHLDVAMRGSSREAPDLMALLVAATNDPKMVAELKPKLDKKPVWMTSFLMSMVVAGPDVTKAVELIRGRLDPRNDDERRVLAKLVQRLAEEGRFDLAWSIYREARPNLANGSVQMIRDQVYEAATGFPPFDWQLSDDPGLTAIRQRGSDGQPPFVLALVANEGRAGTVAKQLVRLPQGRHVLRFEAGGLPTHERDRPQFSIACSSSPAIPFFQIRPIASGVGPMTVRAAFVVPNRCRWQTVSLDIRGSETPSAAPWVANIHIEPEPDPRT